MMLLRIFIPVLFLGSLLACQRKPKPPKAEEGLVVAKVGDIKITDKALEARIKSIEKTFPRKYTAFNQKKELLQQMMNIELLHQEALKKGLDQRYEFKSRLADLYVRELARKARETITDEQIREKYEANREQYDQVSARHILMKFDRNPTAEEKAELKRKIKELRKQVLADPSSFPNIARKHSMDSTARQGGEVGFFSRQMMVRPFSKAAFALKEIGDISPIVESRYGYHIIQLSGDKRGFSHFKALIRNEIVRSTQQNRLNEEIARLRKGKDYLVYKDNLRKITPLPDIVNQEIEVPENGEEQDKPMKQ